MQFADGNRIDLNLYPVQEYLNSPRDSLSRVLLDKDGIIGSLPPPSEADYIPLRPTHKQFAESCNEFWWVATYVAKGLWREQTIYAKDMLEQILRTETMRMLAWYVGVKTSFQVNPGSHGKRLREFLDPPLWKLLEQTYTDASVTRTWDALFAMVDLFRRAALAVGHHFSFEYPLRDDQRVTAHLKHVRLLPKDALAMY
jgi:aminoglycoside 6-adenylyltransferase